MDGCVGASPCIWPNVPGCRSVNRYRYVGTSGLEVRSVSMRTSRGTSICTLMCTPGWAGADACDGMWEGIREGMHPGGYSGMGSCVHGGAYGWVSKYICTKARARASIRVHTQGYLGTEVQTDRHIQVGKAVWKQVKGGTDAGPGGKMWECLGEDRERDGQNRERIGNRVKKIRNGMDRKQGYGEGKRAMERGEWRNRNE